MQIEIRKGHGSQPWRGNLRNGSEITYFGEHHRSMRDAIRAAKAVARAFYRIPFKVGLLTRMPEFTEPMWRERTQCWVIKVGFPGAGS